MTASPGITHEHDFKTIPLAVGTLLLRNRPQPTLCMAGRLPLILIINSACSLVRLSSWVLHDRTLVFSRGVIHSITSSTCVHIYVERFGHLNGVKTQLPEIATQVCFDKNV